MSLERVKSSLQSLYASDAGAVGSPDSPGRVPISPVVVNGDVPPKVLSPYRSHPSLCPIHVRASISLLATADRVGTAEGRPQANFRGILNLFFIILFVLNVRLIVENILRYGPLLHLPRIGLFDSPLIFFGYLLVLSPPYLSYVAERYVSVRSRRWANILQSLLVTGTLVLPYVIVRNSDTHPLRSLFLLMASLVYSMKIGSYWHSCSDMHELHKSGSLKSVDVSLLHVKPISDSQEIVEANLEAVRQYPQCLSARQMYMFIAYPTLVFQLVYPRTSSVRLKVVLRYTLELVFCVFLQFVLIEQYLNPLLANTIKGIDQRIQDKQSIVSLCSFLLERFLKLSVPNVYIWLLMFAELFHCYLNLLAELTMFADRRFYLDWWNAVSIRDYWQKWNLPVHHWLLRHMYKPLRKAEFSSGTAGLIVFIMSGVIHEYLIITPIGVPWSGLVTFGFVSQIPLIMLTDTVFVKNRPTFGNCLFWITSCFTGQPFATLVHFVAASSPTVIPSLYAWVVHGTIGKDEL